MKIQGTIKRIAIGPGFWGIVDNEGREFRPVNLPEQLKKEGKQVTVSVREVDEEMSIFMWRTAVEITSFQT